jgi:hypothetical protein
MSHLWENGNLGTVVSDTALKCLVERTESVLGRERVKT